GRRALAAMILLLAGSGPGTASTEFDEASVRFEQNTTDGDFEFVFEITGGDEGLEVLNVLAPDGRTVVQFSAPDRSTLGMRHFRFESPEPPNYALLTSAYPEGVYLFSGSTVSGDVLHGEAELSHELPPTVADLHPADARGVPIDGLVISWSAVAGAAAYAIEVEQDDLGVAVEASLPGSATSFAVPDGFLAAGTEYKLGVGTVSESGNISVVETTFTTASSSP
ncbi:MAG: hypothetical protein K8E66_02240, partial [Phycisphaerales bacterium]|nr:hypothetical protein [Phycisphaerales bacterium]